MKCISPLCLLAILRNIFPLCSKCLPPIFIIFLIESLAMSIIFLSVIGSRILLWVSFVFFKLLKSLLSTISIERLVSARIRTYMLSKGIQIFKRLFTFFEKVDIMILNILLHSNILKTANVLFCKPYKID